MSLRQFKSFF
jgi:hypothetical protein